MSTYLPLVEDLTGRIVLLSAVLVITLWLVQASRIFTPSADGIPKVPQPWRLPFTWQYWNEPTPDVLWQWKKSSPLNAGILKYSGVGNERRILVTDRQAVRDILQTRCYREFKRPENARKRLVALTGNGLTAAEGPAHKAQRRMLGPSFSPRAIRQLYPMFWEKACEMSNSLLEECRVSNETGWQSLELRPKVSRCALDIIGVAVWGYDTEAIRHPQSDFVQKYEARLEATAEMVFVKALGLLFPMSLVTRLPLRSARILRTGTAFLREYCSQALSERGRVVSGEDLLSRIIGSDALESDESAIDHMLTMLLAGHDTSTVSVTWACFYLCKHLSTQEQLRREIRSCLLSPQDPDSGYDPVSVRIPLLEAVLNETLRLMPPIPMIRREALHQTEILGHSIAAGTHIVICPYVLNRSIELWGPDAEHFNPQRWMGDDNTTHLQELMTFGYGPRSCIGQTFARGEVLTVLATLIGRFEMRLDNSVPEPRPLWGLTATPDNGLRVQMRPLGSW